MRPINRLRLPLVAGSELAGVVERTGPGVTRFAPGDRVFARADKSTMGAFADYAAVEESLLAKFPDELDFQHAAGLPLAGLTALQALRDQLGVGPGGRLYITGGAGGVGTLAIQIAKALGAEVATTASGPLLEALFWLASAKIRRAARKRRIRYRYLFMHPSGTDLEYLGQLVRRGDLSVVVDRVYPLERIAEAFAYLEQGRAKGKVIVEMA